MDNAHHVVGCLLTQWTRVHNALDDAASTSRQALWVGAGKRVLGGIRPSGGGRRGGGCGGVEGGMAWPMLLATS
jgi:hypothetical protein